MGFAWVWKWSERLEDVREAVRRDWLARLPEEKLHLFTHTVARLESSYHMLSVALDGALAMRGRGELVWARRQTAITAGLCQRFEAELGGALRSLEGYALNVGTLPAVSSLEAGNFRRPTAQAAVRWNGLLELVLLSSRSRFLHKLHTLSTLVADLCSDFCRAAEELVEGVCTRPDDHWQALDDLHFDLTSCLQETKVMLKSFLRALPAEQVDPFRRSLAAQPTVVAPLAARVPSYHR